MIEGKDLTAIITSPVDSMSEVRQPILGKWQHDRQQRETAVEAKSNDDWQTHHYERKEDEKFHPLI